MFYLGLILLVVSVIVMFDEGGLRNFIQSENVVFLFAAVFCFILAIIIKVIKRWKEVIISVVIPIALSLLGIILIIDAIYMFYLKEYIYVLGGLAGAVVCFSIAWTIREDYGDGIDFPKISLGGNSRRDNEPSWAERMLDDYRADQKFYAKGEGRKFGEWEIDGDHISHSFGDFSNGFLDESRRIVERDPAGKWVRDEYGQIHVRDYSSPWDDDD